MAWSSAPAIHGSYALRHCESEREIDQRSRGVRMELGRIHIEAPGERKTAGAWPLHLAMVGAL
jgi:hypothetical protein